MSDTMFIVETNPHKQTSKVWNCNTVEEFLTFVSWDASSCSTHPMDYLDEDNAELLKTFEDEDGEVDYNEFEAACSTESIIDANLAWLRRDGHIIEVYRSINEFEDAECPRYMNQEQFDADKNYLIAIA